MLMLREKIPVDWLPKVLANIPAVLVDHAHLERKAATSALNLEKYRDLYHRVGELNAIAIEELQHFQMVLDLLKQRGIPFGQPHPSPWITAMMRSIRKGVPFQAIDHLIVFALVEGRSCEKFQLLAQALPAIDAGVGEVLRGPRRIGREPLRDLYFHGARIDHAEADRGWITIWIATRNSFASPIRCRCCIE